MYFFLIIQKKYVIFGTFNTFYGKMNIKIPLFDPYPSINLSLLHNLEGELSYFIGKLFTGMHFHALL